MWHGISGFEAFYDISEDWLLGFISDDWSNMKFLRKSFVIVELLLE